MRVDTVVTDIDGVLVDTSSSYRRAIVESVRATFGTTVDPEEIQALKDAGGFNNDWRTTDAVALYILAGREGYRGDLESFAQAIEARGGGLEGAKAVIQAEFVTGTRDRILESWNPDRLRRTFQWLYLGPSRYAELEEEPPPPDPPERAGFMEDEPILMRDETREYLLSTYEIGVLTGRPKAEATIALDRVGLDLPTERVMTMDDWDGGKPDPAGLLDVADACDGKRVAYVGDELDDVRTATNADRIDAHRRYVGIGVLSGGLSGPDGREALLDAGAMSVLDSINDLPRVLASD